MNSDRTVFSALSGFLQTPREQILDAQVGIKPLFWVRSFYDKIGIRLELLAMSYAADLPVEELDWIIRNLHLLCGEERRDDYVALCSHDTSGNNLVLLCSDLSVPRFILLSDKEDTPIEISDIDEAVLSLGEAALVGIELEKDSPNPRRYSRESLAQFIDDSPKQAPREAPLSW